MSIQEARAALEAEQGECWHERSGAEGRNHVMTKADTYALAVLEEYGLAMLDAKSGFDDCVAYAAVDGANQAIRLAIGGKQ